MANAFENTNSIAQTIIALAIDEDNIKLFVGQTQGKLVEPKGNKKFGWDCLFVPNNQNLTYGEMTMIEKEQISHRSKAIKLFVDYIKNNN